MAFTDGLLECFEQFPDVLSYGNTLLKCKIRHGGHFFLQNGYYMLPSITFKKRKIRFKFWWDRQFFRNFAVYAGPYTVYTPKLSLNIRKHVGMGNLFPLVSLLIRNKIYLVPFDRRDIKKITHLFLGCR